MLLICEEYAERHDLKFSTDPNPVKCKTKCLAFIKKKRQLPNLKLCGNSIPWVGSGKHLGNVIEDKIDGLKKDMRVKRAKYITKNNELCQEFHHCHPQTKFHLNYVYNSSFSGSPLWDLFSRESEMIENTWNTSFRIMFDLSFKTHRYFVQPVSEKVHIKNILLKRFLGFLNQIQNSSKKLPGALLRVVSHDTRSTTGSNLRNILLLTDKNRIEDITTQDLDNFCYAPTRPEDLWKIEMVKELIDVRAEKYEVSEFAWEELDEILEHLCID